MKNRSSEVKAFRLDAELLKAVKTIAKREGISENAFVQSVLWQRVRADLLIRAFPIVALSGQSLAQILSTSNPNLLDIAALELGRRNFGLVRELYASVGTDMDFARYLGEVLDKQARWFELEGVNVNPQRITLRHNYGMKWSLFLRSFLISAYEVVSDDKMKIGITDTFLSVEFPSSFR